MFAEKKVIDRVAWMARLGRSDSYLYAMYSSVVDGIVTDADLMMVPVDDHVVHRGDGVFESFKCVDGCLYNLEDHLIRLQHSCDAVGIELPVSFDELGAVIKQTILAGKQRNALVRLLVTRGVGTMGIDPYACSGVQYYVVVYELKNKTASYLPHGLRAVSSSIPMKPSFFARVKSCNYLPNVLMKKEAVDRGVEYAISFDENDCLGEGATENAGIVTSERALLFPPPERVLAGTTAKRVHALAQKLVETGMLKCAEYRPISREMVRGAAEMHVYGTTTNVTPIVEFDGAPVGAGVPGPVAEALFALLRDDMVPDSQRLINIFE